MIEDRGEKVKCVRCGKKTYYFVIGCYGSVDDGEPICPKCLDKHYNKENKMGITMEELTIDERIKILHGVIDNLKGSTKIEFEIEARFIDYPNKTGRLKLTPTGETEISISAYNPKMDKR